MNRYLLIFCLGLSLFACKEDEKVNPAQPATPVVFVDTLILNPSGYAPLTAIAQKQTREATRVQLTIRGKNQEPDFVHDFNEFKTQHSTTILGLYGAHLNTVILRYINQGGTVIEEKTHLVQTDSLNVNLPDIQIKVKDSSAKSPGWTLVSYFGIITENKPFIFDDYGNIRWYLDFANHPELASLRYDNGIEISRNGNLFFGNIPNNKIYEINFLGETINSFGLGNHQFHHQVFEASNNDFIITTSKNSSIHNNGDPTVEDYVIRVNRNTGALLNEWDLKNSFDEDRTIWTGTVLTNPVDWFHGNGLIEDGTQGDIIVSGRTQGIVKVKADNTPAWIIATHKDWDTSRLGYRMADYLLQPLDANNMPISDTSVLNGYTNHPDFEWPWYPHAPKRLPNGNLICFDNGDNRNYTGAENYSRAVEYEIDEQNMTIKQVWSYGKARGTETYSRIVSDVDYLADKDNVLFSPGFGLNSGSSGKIVEVDYSTKQVVFEADINPPAGVFLAFTRAERLFIYQ